MAQRTVMITGGSGLVGRNLLENDNLKSYRLLYPSHSDLDLCDYDAVLSYIDRNKPDFIIHAAGHVGGILANMKDLYGYFMPNILMGLNIVRAAKETGIKNLLNLSSSCTYPCDAQSPLKENIILTGRFEPTNEGYAIAKTAVLKACEYITTQNQGFNYKTIIPCNLYGPYDKFSPENSHFMPAIIRKIHEAKENHLNEITIWGDGQARRELLYVKDLCSIIALALERFDQLPAIMNVGTGIDYTIDQYYESACNVMGLDAKFTHDLTKPSGMRQKLMDISRQKELGLNAVFTLEQGISETYEYYLGTCKG